MSAGVGGILLAGGAGRRMGGLKHRQMLGPSPLVSYGLRLLRRHCEQIQVTSADAWVDDWLEAGEQRIEDTLAQCGPLGGLLTALEGARHGWNLVLAVDLPFLPDGLPEVLLSHRPHRPAMVIPVTPDGPEPLASLVHSGLRQSLCDYLASGQRRVMGWLERLESDLILVEWPYACGFENLNDRQALTRAERRLEERSSGG